MDLKFRIFSEKFDDFQHHAAAFEAFEVEAFEAFASGGTLGGGPNWVGKRGKINLESEGLFLDPHFGNGAKFSDLLGFFVTKFDFLLVFGKMGKLFKFARVFLDDLFLLSPHFESYWRRATFWRFASYGHIPLSAASTMSEFFERCNPKISFQLGNSNEIDSKSIKQIIDILIKLKIKPDLRQKTSKFIQFLCIIFFILLLVIFAFHFKCHF